MDINKRNRTELKQYFEQGDQPTEQQFSEFIDAGINQAEDGIAKIQGAPLSIQAEGDSAGSQEVLDLFSKFTDDNPKWSLNLNPTVDPQEPDSNQEGLNIKDATGQSRLFIKSGKGDVGIGTIEPTSKLTIQGKNDTSLLSVIDTTQQHAKVFEVTQNQGNGIVSLRSGENEEVVRLNGKKDATSFLLTRLGVGTNTPKAALSILGTGKESDPDDALHITNRSILFGGPNVGRSEASAKIIAHDSNTLRIMGMSSDESSSTRKVDIFSEGGMSVKGNMTAKNRLDVDGMLTAKTNMQVQQNLTINGNITAKNRLDVEGLVNAKTDMEIQQKLTVKGAMTVEKRIKIPIDQIVAFSVSIKDNNLSGVREPVVFDHVNYNHGNHFNNNRFFIAPVKGFYQFTMTISPPNNSSSSSFCVWQLKLNDTGFVNENDEDNAPAEVGEIAVLRARFATHSCSRTVITQLNAGDKIRIRQTGSSSPDNYASGFEGILLQALT
ncbi:C1q-like domain-containing protein [Aquimarina celericrescens]|uniref:C1q domain-containing protein n=1 Tax=Aquimarina celericrescens TaxID=1964542 RepID=A0ABW5AXZ4_9FLAO|nr:polymer-forming cytoskeletal protein [Aquimarina celericrescens]